MSLDKKLVELTDVTLGIRLAVMKAWMLVAVKVQMRVNELGAQWAVVMAVWMVDLKADLMADQLAELWAA